ncbi:hypothetical protein pb186bvf_016974 [Paramecium bursaria]
MQYDSEDEIQEFIEEMEPYISDGYLMRHLDGLNHLYLSEEMQKQISEQGLYKKLVDINKPPPRTIEPIEYVNEYDEYKKREFFEPIRKRYYHINYYEFCSDCREHGHLYTKCPNYYVRYCVYCLSVFHKEEYCHKPEEETNLIEQDVYIVWSMGTLIVNHDPNASQ